MNFSESKGHPNARLIETGQEWLDRRRALSTLESGRESALLEDDLPEGVTSHPLLSADEELKIGRQIRITIESGLKVVESRFGAGALDSIAFARDFRGGAPSEGGPDPTLRYALLDAVVCELDCPDAARFLKEARRHIHALVNHSLRLVAKLARGFLRPGYRLTFLDLFQEGALGLVKAAERWDPERGCRFSTYADSWVRSAIQQCIADQSRTVRLPVYQHKRFQRLHRVQQDLTLDLGREPSEFELSEALEMSPSDVRGLIESSVPPVSLQEPIKGVHTDPEDGNSVVGDLIESGCEEPDIEVGQEVLKKVILAGLSQLTRRQSDVVRRRFGIDCDPMTGVEVAEVLGISVARVRELETLSLRWLRQIFSEDGAYC